MIAPPTLLVCPLGTIEYAEAWDLQRELTRARRDGRIDDVLLLLEHPPTYTLGRRGKEEHILLSMDELRQRGISLHHVDRGGDVTYHGPGQLVGYPILKLPPERLNYVRYIRDVERSLLLAVRDLGVPATLEEGYSGVWLGREKLCAIGVKIDASGVTSHGFALNVSVDLSYFEHIIPCGIVDRDVTSLDRVLGSISVREAAAAVLPRLAETFGLSPCVVSPTILRSLLADAARSTEAAAPA